jgi:mono/diheme cytochrome c family protein
MSASCLQRHVDGVTPMAAAKPGRGPQLMDTKRDDDYLRNRIKNGKVGSMPAFATMFSDAQIDEIIKYIRELKPHEG